MPDTSKDGLRPLRPSDLDRVVEIDGRLSGRLRRGFFEKRLQAALADPDAFVAVGVGEEGKLDAFAFTRIQAGEFGDEHAVAILDAVGVNPDSQRHGLGRRLMDGIDERLRRAGVREIRTQVNWNDQGLLSYFAAVGFDLAPRQVLDRSASQPVSA